MNTKILIGVIIVVALFTRMVMDLGAVVDLRPNRETAIQSEKYIEPKKQASTTKSLSQYIEDLRVSQEKSIEELFQVVLDLSFVIDLQYAEYATAPGFVREARASGTGYSRTVEEVMATAKKRVFSMKPYFDRYHEKLMAFDSIQLTKHQKKIVGASKILKQGVDLECKLISIHHPNDMAELTWLSTSQARLMIDEKIKKGLGQEQSFFKNVEKDPNLSGVAQADLMIESYLKKLDQ